MTNLELAQGFALAHSYLDFDAVIIDAAVAGSRIHGPIFLDQKGRFEDGTVVTTSEIISGHEGGRVIFTRNTRYLVQMAAETEQARREDSMLERRFEGDAPSAGGDYDVDPAELNDHFDQSLEAMVAEPAPVIEASPFREVAQASAERFDRYAHRDGSRECRPTDDRFALVDGSPEAGPYAIGSDRVNGLSKLIEEAGEVVQVAGKIIGLGGLGVHFDGSDLTTRLEEELADLLAGIDFVIVRNRLDRAAISARRVEKRETFEVWNAGAQPADREAA